MKFWTIVAILLAAPILGAQVEITAVPGGGVVLTDGGTTLRIEVSAERLAQTLLALSLGDSALADVPGTFSVVEAPAEPEPEPPPPEPEPEPEPPVGLIDSISSDGITWTLATPTQGGQFITGDWWVVGPVVVSSVSPGWDGERNGSMVDPVGFGEATAAKQGIDDLLARYDEAFRAKFPLPLSPGQSLVSTQSWRFGESGAPSTVTATLPGATRPTVRRAAVLTCVAAPPPHGSFRPPYAGGAKPMHNAADMIDLEELPRWPLPTNAPSVASTISGTTRLWFNIREKWHARYFRPDEAMPDYGRDLAAKLGDAMLLLLCDIPTSDKRELALNIIQIAIDQRGVFETGYVAGRDGGGISVGWHGPLVIGGHLLNSVELRDYFVGKPVRTTQEMAQIARDAQGLYWREDDKRTRADPGSTSYRKCCTSNGYIAHVLVARALGLEESWGHPDSFPYHDAYMDEAFSESFHYAWSPWQRTMWLNTDGGRHSP